MKYGLMLFATDYAIRPTEIAKEAESRGFESLFFPEHTHIPASRLSPYPGGGELPKDYWHTHDPFVALAQAAVVTTRLKLGTGICLVIERDPIVLAKETATLDFLSDGRFIMGIGAGWNREEMENHGTDFRTRWKLLRERVEAIKAIWTQEEASYHGEMVKFDRIWSYPKPVQKPHPPIYLGGHGEKALKRVVRYCDGWMPLPMRSKNLGQEIKELHRLAEEAGRDPKSITVSTFWTQPDKAVVEEYAKIGVDRVIFGVPSEGRDKVLPLLDQLAKLIH